MSCSSFNKEYVYKYTTGLYNTLIYIFFFVISFHYIIYLIPKVFFQFFSYIKLLCVFFINTISHEKVICIFFGGQKKLYAWDVSISVDNDMTRIYLFDGSTHSTTVKHEYFIKIIFGYPVFGCISRKKKEKVLT